MKVWSERAVEWMRRLLIGDLPEMVAQLQRDVEAERVAARDPAVIGPMVMAALRAEVRAEPARIAALLAPIVEDILRQREVTPMPPPRQHRALRRLAAVAVLLAGLVLPRVTGVSEATGGDRLLTADAKGAPVILEERNDGFGLGEAHLTDDQLVREVRSRLSNCTELAGARVSFSVKDGWVWLRGEASSGGREAAERALGDLGEGVFVVDQLADSTTSAVASR